MTLPSNDTETDTSFPPSPIEGTERLVPIESWLEMFGETQVTGVEFDEYWYESVEAGAAYFFRWLDKPRATVLVVWNMEQPTHIECRMIGDVLMADIDTVPIVAEVTHLFRCAGFWQGQAVQ